MTGSPSCPVTARRRQSGANERGWSLCATADASSPERGDLRASGLDGAPAVPHERLAERDPRVMAVETERLVQMKGTRRVLGVDAQGSLVESFVPEGPQRVSNERAGEAPAAIRASNGDVLEPASPHPKLVVLPGEDVVHDRTGDLVAGPGDPPERRVDPRDRHHRDEILVGPLGWIPVIAEGLCVCIPDAAMIGLDHRSNLETLGQGRIRDGLRERPRHHESIADSSIALRFEQGDRPGLLLADLGREAMRFHAGPFGRSLSPASLRPTQQRPADALSPHLGTDPAGELMLHNTGAEPDAVLGSGDEPAVDLGEEHVAARVEMGAMLDLVAKILDRWRVFLAVGGVRLEDQVHDGLEVAVDVERSDSEPGDRGEIRQYDLRAGEHRRRRLR